MQVLSYSYLKLEIDFRYRFIINNCPIAVGVGDVVECAASLITRVRLVSPISGDIGCNGNLSTSLWNVARLAAHPKIVWVFNANCDGTIICITYRGMKHFAQICY
jgi:hypothetical protein